MKKTLLFCALLLLMGCSDTFVCEKINNNIWYNDKCYTKNDYNELKRQEEREAEEEQQRAQRKEEIESLASERDTIKTLQFYDDYFFEKFDRSDNHSNYYGFKYDGYSEYQNNNFESGHKLFEVQFATSVPLQYDKNCFIYTEYDGYTNDSDECVLARRNHKSKIHFFNFKKYLPTKSVIKTEDEFLHVFHLYKNIINIPYEQRHDANSDLFHNAYYGRKVNTAKYYKRSCYLNAPLTSTETEKCYAEDLQFIRDVVSGKAPKCSKKYQNLYKKSWNECDQLYFGLVNLCNPDISVGYCGGSRFGN